MKSKIGIIGGMGPLATTIFMKMVIDNTNAITDQENVPMVILNDTETPDRTDFLLGKSDNNPLPNLMNDIKMLERIGCTDIAMICNTAHAFYDVLQKNNNVNIINMIDLTLKECKKRGFNKLGLLATKGTIKTKIYETFNNYDLELIIPSDDIQEIIESYIYNYVKKNVVVSNENFTKLLNYFYELGCDGVIMGCTELSVIFDYLNLQKDKKIIDSTLELSKEVIKISGKKLK